MPKFVLAFISAFFLVTSPAVAKDGRAHGWIVTQLSGDARIVHVGLQPASLRVNAKLAPGDLIVTGVNGRATLSNQADYIVIAPRSSMRLPATEQPSGFTRVIQNLGTMLFRVQHTGTPHFAVDTPMLAAVVKGTTFTIIVDQNRSAVQVTQGVVQVTANDGGMNQLVEGGKTVFINRSDPKTIIDADSNPAKASTTTGAAVKVNGTAPASVTTIASLTGGLVRPATTTETPSATPIVTVTTATAVPTRSLVVELVESSADGASEPGDATTAVFGTTEQVVETVTESVSAEPVNQGALPGTTEAVVQTVESALPSVTEPVAQFVETSVPAVTGPVVETIETLVPAVTDPVVDIVETIAPTVTDPVVQTVETIVPAVSEPVVQTIDTIVPAVTDPVVQTVETVIPTVTDPVVQTAVPAVIDPVVQTVETVAPTVIQPIVDTVAPTVPAVPQPVVETVAPIVPAVTQPVVAPVQTLLPPPPPLPLLKPGI